MMGKFTIGDKVKIIKYGHLLLDGNGIHDMSPEIVGKIGIIKDVAENQGITRYSIKGIPEKVAWYNENQLESTSD